MLYSVESSLITFVQTTAPDMFVLFTGQVDLYKQQHQVYF